MKGIKWRKWFRVLHRDLGYLFFGMTVVYAVSGIALNHRRDWNPNYRVETISTTVPDRWQGHALTRDDVAELLKLAGVEETYKKHYSPRPGSLRIFLNGGVATYLRDTGEFSAEILKRRPIFYTFNKLHYNPSVWWTWFADIFCAALLIVAITGLFLIKGYYGITRRGGVLALLGILIPGILAYMIL